MKIFAPEGMYPPAGMFTPQHLISLFICLVIIFLAVHFSKNISYNTLRKITFYISIFTTVCEIIKIAYKFIVCHYAFLDFDRWVPLYFCSIFIFATWMSLAKSEFIRRLGISFICCGCITGGLAFLIFPTTSLQMVPIWHFLSIHSMLFHTLMVYLGFMYIYKGFFEKGIFKYYSICFGIFLVPSIILNIFFNCNMMLIREPFNMPFKFINNIFNLVPWLYPFLAISVYLFIPYGISYFTNYILNRIKPQRVLIEHNA